MNDQENTIEKIKQTALDEFFMHGYNKASLRMICSRAGVTTGAMYFYFKNKEALFREIFEPLVVQYEELLVRYMELELAEPELGTQLDVQMMRFILPRAVLNLQNITRRMTAIHRHSWIS